MSKTIAATKSLEINYNSSKYFFKGMIDGTFQPDWAGLFKEDELVFNFNDLSYINSSGVMSFGQFLKNLRPVQKISYEQVPAIVIGQMGLTRGLVSDQYFPRSFYVPYINEKLDDQIHVLLTFDEVKDGKIPPKRHPADGSMIVPDVLESKFLNFLKFLK